MVNPMRPGIPIPAARDEDPAYLFAGFLPAIYEVQRGYERQNEEQTYKVFHNDLRKSYSGIDL